MQNIVNYPPSFTRGTFVFSFTSLISIASSIFPSILYYHVLLCENASTVMVAMIQCLRSDDVKMNVT